jgi:coenzyme F420-reducing hydrogenase delta subunit/Pyruvate/2-oxoacid:ferredoxin oxidoreductase delta subunit
LWTAIGLPTAVAIVWPLTMAPRADPFALPDMVPIDLFFAFWMPITERLGGGTALSVLMITALLLLVVPLMTARRGAEAPAPSSVDEDICVGCVQCSIDCPYGAITMIDRVSPRSNQVARVDPTLCVSCAICAGSCAPMGVGPAGRDGRTQVGQVQAYLASPAFRAGGVVVIGCEHGAAGSGALAAEPCAVYQVSCAGALHTSVIEMLLRGGAAGILVLACPPRDCWHREGVRWLVERVYHDREAELQARVDRARVRIAHANASEGAIAIAAVRAFVADVAALRAPDIDRAGDTGRTCETAGAVHA